MVPWVMILVACSVIPKDAATPDPSITVLPPEDSGLDDATDTDLEGDPTSPVDADGDGWPAGEDCDDSDPDVHPNAPDDTCDGIDNDCDDSVDDDVAPDAFEVNDPDGSSLGEVTGDDATATAYLFPEGDEDVFRFYVEDSVWDWFGISLDLTVPGGVDMVMELYLETDGGPELLATIDDGGVGRDESGSYDGSAGGEDSGWYIVRLHATGGARCDTPYSLLIET